MLLPTGLKQKVLRITTHPDDLLVFNFIELGIEFLGGSSLGQVWKLRHLSPLDPLVECLEIS